MAIHYTLKAHSPEKFVQPRGISDHWDYCEEFNREGGEFALSFVLGRAAKWLDKNYGEDQWRLTDEGQFVPVNGVGGGRVLLHIECHEVDA